MVFFPFRNTDVGSRPNITATMVGFQDNSKTITIKPGDNPVTIPLQPITDGKSLLSQISTDIHFTVEPIFQLYAPKIFLKLSIPGVI